MAKSTVVTLPWPPSVNRYWRNVKGRTLISREGREYRKTLRGLLFELDVSCIETGEIEVSIHAYPPDKRRRDLDNILKALLDSLQHGGAFADDFQIARLSVKRMDVKDGGEVVVYIQPIEGI